MSGLVGYLLLFLVIGSGFVFIHLVIGKFIRPSKPSAEKQTIYECGEPTIGSAWVQFDLRFYVVALLFVIFDVEVAFFFPWAVVFGQSNNLSHVETPRTDAERLAYIQQLNSLVPPQMQTDEQKALAALGSKKATEAERTAAAERFAAQVERDRSAARSSARLAFIDILIFFGVLLVGFAYLWARGDLKWVRSLASEEGEPAAPPAPAPKSADKVLVGTGR